MVRTRQLRTPPPNKTPVKPQHPATYSSEITEELKRLVHKYAYTRETLCLDPFAGVGQDIEYIGVTPIKVELEQAWAVQTWDGRMVRGDSRQLPFRDNMFSLIVTSPTYSNRLSDHHIDNEFHRQCDGMGCADCNFSGIGKTQKRITYFHYLRYAGHTIDMERNSGVLGWGAKYHALHEAVWAEVTRVSVIGARFFLNTSDYVKAGKMVHVTGWHLNALMDLGWRLVEEKKVATPRMRRGANANLRAKSESIMVLELRSK